MAIIRCFIFRLGCKTGCIFQKFLHPDTCKRLINGYKSAFFGVQIFAPRLLRLFTVRSTRENFGGNVEICGAAATSVRILRNVGECWRLSQKSAEPTQRARFCRILQRLPSFQMTGRNKTVHPHTLENAPQRARAPAR